jgi:Xaa-Pro aminopeptidase
MKSYFNSNFFINNRRVLRQRFVHDETIVITANGLLQRGADSSFPFSQDANFWYLTGIDEPDILLVMTQNEEYLIIPTRSLVRETFDGAIAYDKLSSISGIKQVLDDEEGWELLFKQKQLATISPPPIYIEQYGLYANPARHSFLSRIKKANPDIEFIDVGQDLARMRMTKQAPELKAIQSAIDITIASLKAASEPKRIIEYLHEYELEAAIRSGFRRLGAKGDSFEPIVAGGKNACTLHNVSNNSALNLKDLWLADVGAEVEHYAADITRMFSPSKPTNRQKAIYEAVKQVQQFAMDQLKPGVLLKEYEQSVEDFMGEQLISLKIIKSASHESIRKFYPHSTSHFLGLNVHDVGDYRQPLSPNTVLTVEPGIYVPEEGIGVRIEDDVLITDTGIKVLSKALTTKL